MKFKKKILCRVCLQCDLDADGVTNIFEENDSFFIYEKLNAIAELQIKPEDGLPDKICGDCLLELENAINFKQKCQTSNNILVSAVNAGIGATQDDDEDPLDAVKSEPEECADQEYLEEDVWSSPEVSVKSEPDPQFDDTALFTPPAKKSRAVDLELECHDCGGSFKSKCKLKVHWKNVHLKEQLTCPVCKKTFGSFKRRKEHDVNKTRRCKTYSRVNVTGEGKNRVLHCRECEYSSSSINNMAAHLVKHTGERNYACKLCPKQYSQFLGLQCHMESKHGTEKERVCKFCNETITGRMKYTKHLRHHRNFNAYETCKICNKKIKKAGLKQHMAIHSNLRTFTCEKCAATFKVYSSLWAHNRHVHQENIKLYKCDKCAYSTKHSYILNKHQNKHTGNDFPCNECGRFFENDLQLSLHMQRHTNKNHKCLQCESTFYQRKHLLVHVNKKHKTYINKYK